MRKAAKYLDLDLTVVNFVGKLLVSNKIVFKKTYRFSFSGYSSLGCFKTAFNTGKTAYGSQFSENNISLFVSVLTT